MMMKNLYLLTDIIENLTHRFVTPKTVKGDDGLPSVLFTYDGVEHSILLMVRYDGWYWQHNGRDYGQVFSSNEIQKGIVYYKKILEKIKGDEE